MECLQAVGGLEERGIVLSRLGSFVFFYGVRLCLIVTFSFDSILICQLMRIDISVSFSYTTVAISQRKLPSQHMQSHKQPCINNDNKHACYVQ